MNLRPTATRIHPWLTLAVLICVPPTLTRAQEKPIPVVQEPFHKVTFENAYLRMIDVHFPPGATTLYHFHVIPSVVVDMSDATITTQEWGTTTTASRKVIPGQSRYAPYDEKMLSHRVTNTGSTVFHVLDIELLRSGAKLADSSAIAPTGAKLDWEQKLARLYSRSLAAGAKFEIPASRCAHLLIAVKGDIEATSRSNGEKTPRPMKAGEYAFFAPDQPVSVASASAAADCLVLQLK